jgi:Raf kinase inhibitor-like YbhB/YbcL family protein
MIEARATDEIRVSMTFGTPSYLHLSPVILLLLQLACTRVTVPPGTPSLELSSTSFPNGGAMPATYTCDGRNISPELSWNSGPAGTQSFVLIVTDRDSPFGYAFVHWLLYDLPGDARELQEGIGSQPQLPNGARQGTTDFDKIGYGGPCPPGKSTHRYVFALYALDTKLNLPPGAAEKQLVKAMKGHVVAAGEFIGRYHH